MDIRRGLTAAGIFMTALGGFEAAARTDERPRIALHIKNHAGVDRDDLARARAEVERIFDTADIKVAWVDAEGEGRIAILLLTLTRDSQEDAVGCALGLAIASRSTAYVFVNRIVRTTRNGAVDVPVAIGRVMAHEIGHILMPERRHSRFGIMRGDLDAGYSNPASFSGEEAQTMRKRLQPGSHPGAVTAAGP